MRQSSTTKSSRQKKLRILFTCVGRRIELVDAFRKAAAGLRIDLQIHGSDINTNAPAMHHVDCQHIVPRINHKRHIPTLLELVSKNKINALIPLIDSDLAFLSRSAKQFAERNCEVILSSQDVVKTCSDKMLTFASLQSAGIDTPQTWSVHQALALEEHRFPYFLKPRRGSAGKGLHKIDNLDELRVFANRQPDSVVQEFVRGDEYTMDVYTGLDGQPKCVVPRKRIEIRSGEVSKGLIVKNAAIMEIGRKVVSALGGCRGVVTVQCMVTPRGRIRVIEINPRFGGGAPLAIHAGADFPKWLMAELLGRQLRVDYDAYRDNLMMLRYDRSVFIDGDTETRASQKSRTSAARKSAPAARKKRVR